MSWIFLSCDLFPCTAAISLNCLQALRVFPHANRHGVIWICHVAPLILQISRINDFGR